MRQIKAAFLALGFQIKKKEIKSLLSSIGKEGAHTVTFDEFVGLVTPRVLSRDPKEEIQKVFQLISEGADGVRT